MSSSPDAEAIRVAETMAQQFANSWSTADGAAYGLVYWDDAELVDPTGAIWNGRQAIAKMHVDLWAGPFKGSNVSARVRRIRSLGSDFLLVDLEMTLRGTKGAPPGASLDSEGAIHTHLKHVLERRGGAWKVVAAQNTFAGGP